MALVVADWRPAGVTCLAARGYRERQHAGAREEERQQPSSQDRAYVKAQAHRHSPYRPIFWKHESALPRGQCRQRKVDERPNARGQYCLQIALPYRQHRRASESISVLRTHTAHRWLGARDTNVEAESSFPIRNRRRAAPLKRRSRLITP